MNNCSPANLPIVQLSYFPFRLNFKSPFRISHGIRSYTDVVYVKLEQENFTGWGEAALPPYLQETQKSVMEYLTTFSRTFKSDSIDEWFEVLKYESKNMAAKAALDMALWSLRSQTEGKSINELLGITQSQFPLATYTIGVSDTAEMKLKIEEADKNGFEIFKLKLDGANDEGLVKTFRKLSSKRFLADVNQGWKNAEQVLRKIDFLKKENCVLIEQPLKKDSLSEMKQLKQKSSLPLYADESCQGLSDIEKLRECFDGINIKLMKCGGITEAHQMILKARELEMQVLIGCMSESSAGCTAAAPLTALADYADLDGPYLISNDPFEGMKVADGKIQINPLVSKGVIPL